MAEIDRLKEIVEKLRSENGCPWDRAQTHETLTKYMTEEAQEAVEAMLKGDDENLCEVFKSKKR